MDCSSAEARDGLLIAAPVWRPVPQIPPASVTSSLIPTEHTGTDSTSLEMNWCNSSERVRSWILIAESREDTVCWHAAHPALGRSIVDESTDGLELSLQLDSPQVDLAFTLRDLSVVREAQQYPSMGHSDIELCLGKLDASRVSLHWGDEEDRQRCFLIVGSTARSSLRVSLSVEDADSLADAFGQILEDLP